MTFPIVEVDEFGEAITGGVIEGCELYDDGMHFNLQDGRVIIVSGDFCVFVGSVGNGTIQ